MHLLNLNLEPLAPVEPLEPRAPLEPPGPRAPREPFEPLEPPCPIPSSSTAATSTSVPLDCGAASATPPRRGEDARAASMAAGSGAGRPTFTSPPVLAFLVSAASLDSVCVASFAARSALRRSRQRSGSTAGSGVAASLAQSNVSSGCCASSAHRVAAASNGSRPTFTLGGDRNVHREAATPGLPAPVRRLHEREMLVAALVARESQERHERRPLPSL